MTTDMQTVFTSFYQHFRKNQLPQALLCLKVLFLHYQISLQTIQYLDYSQTILDVISRFQQLTLDATNPVVYSCFSVDFSAIQDTTALSFIYEMELHQILMMLEGSHDGLVPMVHYCLLRLVKRHSHLNED